MLDGTLQKAANDAVIMGPAVLMNGKTELRRPGASSMRHLSQSTTRGQFLPHGRRITTRWNQDLHFVRFQASPSP